MIRIYKITAALFALISLMEPALAGEAPPPLPSFIAYHNRMLSLIRDRWEWAGRRSDLETTVRFSVEENGEITGIKIIKPSGDPSFDDSVFRAVSKANPLPPPPAEYRRDFLDVSLTFRPKDLQQSEEVIKEPPRSAPQKSPAKPPRKAPKPELLPGQQKT